LIAAGVDLEANWQRLRALPAERRKKLVDNLSRFDAVLTLEQQQALRDLDRRIHALEPSQQGEYLATLRRYHNWLSRLPEDRRDEIMRTPASERLAAIGKLASQPRYKVASDRTPPFLQLAEIGEYSPFELAAIFKIWQVLTPAKRKEVERPLNNAGRLQVLFRLGEAKKLPREILPEGYDEQRALAELEPYLKKKGHSVLVVDELKKRIEARSAEIMRRQAINFFYLIAEQKGAVKRVAPERLDQFVASFPWWIQSAFESYPPDEARRRLTIIYRLVFPHPSEIKLTPRESLAPPGSRPAPSSTKKAAGPTGGAPGAKSGPPS
jgi:hypothetical protein